MATLPEGDFTERFDYDNRGRQTLHVSFEGVVTEFRYHPQTGRLSQQRFFDNLTSYANGQGTPQEVWSFTHDAFGRLVRLERAVTGGSTSVTTYQYDGEGRVSRITLPEGVVSYTYDDLGWRTAVLVGTPTNPLRKTPFTYYPELEIGDGFCIAVGWRSQTPDRCPPKLRKHCASGPCMPSWPRG